MTVNTSVLLLGAAAFVALFALVFSYRAGKRRAQRAYTKEWDDGRRKIVDELDKIWANDRAAFIDRMRKLERHMHDKMLSAIQSTRSANQDLLADLLNVTRPPDNAHGNGGAPTLRQTAPSQQK
jgi:hypothetical protein